MIKPYFIGKKFFQLMVLSFFVLSANAADRYAVATGRWDRTTTWSATSGGGSGASVPGINDNVYIESGYIVRVSNANATCKNLSVTSGSTLTIAGFTLTVSGTTTDNGAITITSATGTKTFTGAVTISNTGSIVESAAATLVFGSDLTNNGTLTEFGAATVSVAGSFTNNGTFNASSGTHTFSGSSETIGGTSPISLTSAFISGTYTNTGTLTASSALSGSGALTQGINSYLYLGGTSGITTLDAAANFNSVEYYGLAQNVHNTVYYNLLLSGNGAKSCGAALTINGELSISGAASINLGTFISSGNLLSLGGVDQPSGSWGGTGSGATRVNTTYFEATTGSINIGSCAAGLWSGASGTDWNTPSNWCSGSVPTSATNVAIFSGGNQPVIGTAAFCNNITINTGATLTINGSNSLTISGNWVNNGAFNANTSTVILNGAGQSVAAVTYNNLTLSGSGIKTFATPPTVNGILSLEGDATVLVTTGVVTYGTNATLQYNTTNARTTTTEEWITPFAASGGIIISNTGTITLNAAKVLNASVSLTINSGAILATANQPITFGGNFVNGGTLVAGSSQIVIGNTMVNQSIAGFTTTGTVSMTKTGGTATFTGDVNGGGLTINGAGGTLNLGSDLTHTFTGVWTRTTGSLTGGSSLLRIGGNISGTTGTFTAGTGTVEWYASGAQTAGVLTYNNLTLSGSGIKTFATTPTVNGVLSLEGDATVVVTGAGVVTYGTNARLQYNTINARVTTIEEWITPFVATGGVIIANTGTITLDAAKVFNASIPLTINSGSTLVTNNFQLTLGGNFVSGGNLIAGSSPVVIGNAMANQSIAGFTTTGTVSMTKTAGTATLTGDVIGVGLTLNGAGGTLNLGAGLIHTFTGVWTRTAGSLNGGSSTLNLSGSLSGAGGTFTANTGTVNYFASAPQTIATVTYNNLNLSGSGAKTIAASVTITGNMTISGAATASLSNGTASSANALKLGASWQPSGSYGGTGSSATNKNSTYFAGVVTGIINVSTTGCNTASMGYGYERNITIDNTKVSGGSDLYNFPLLINLNAQNFLRSSPTGQILNASGFDIIFTDGNYNKLDHQIEYYNGTNGDLVAWVRIPTLSSSSNTVIKILYGNQQVTIDPSVNTVWDTHFKGVWHLDNSSLNDFTTFNKPGTAFNSPTYPSGRINNSIGLNGTNQYVEVTNDPNINFAGNITVSAWVYMSAGGRDQKIAGNQNGSTGGYKFGIYTNDKVEFEIRNSANVASLNRDEPGGTVLTTGQWYYLAGISSDVLDSIKTVVNGIPERPYKKTGILGIASDNLIISREPFGAQYYFNGMFDELRISDEVRSNGWLKTEYNNQVSPSSFYSVSSEVVSYSILSASICDGPITLTFGYPAGGTYSGNSFISGSTFSPPAAGTYPIIYTYDGGCGASSVSKDFIITDTPPAPTAANKEYCTGQIASLEATSGENIRWYSGGLPVSTANPFSTGRTIPGTYNYTVTQTVNGCESVATAVTLSILTGITIITQPQPTSICSPGSGVFSVEASGYNMNYQWQEEGVNITNGGIYSGATSATLTITNPGIAKNGLLYKCIITSTCGPSVVNSNTVMLTVNTKPVATFNYPNTTYCQSEVNPSPVFTGGGVAGTFSSTVGLDFLSIATGQINLTGSISGTYTVTNTIVSAVCGTITATDEVTVSAQTWTGIFDNNWNDFRNWSCSFVPFQTTVVIIPDVATNDPVLSTINVATVDTLFINTGSSLTVFGNLKISGSIINDGILDATSGSIEMNGTSSQSLGSGIFSNKTIKNLTIDNSSAVSLLDTLKVTGIALVKNGELVSGGHLVLRSTVTGTALIDGSGTGTVTGNVIMQRYITSGYGYKYFSSPFQTATVNEFGDDINLILPSILIYRYDESRTASGWVNYKNIANVLNPMRGYAVNMGASATAKTIDITGVVNNGNISATLYNRNNLYTKGFNLVGNPYPSPIDWDASSGWTKVNIDDAIYYFKASTTDQYGGTYSTYINGISSDGFATNIIPSMQGFFVHVSDGGYPVTGTLGMDNNVRITDQTHSFLKSASIGSASKSSIKSSVRLLRLTATFSDNTDYPDPVALYFSDKTDHEFSKIFDALKLMNTDVKVPNLYAITPSGAKLSICALPDADTVETIPLGLKVNRSGNIVFRVSDVDGSLSGMRIFLSDTVAGVEQELLNDTEYTLNLATGEYKDRFFLNLVNIPKSAEVTDMTNTTDTTGTTDTTDKTDTTDSSDTTDNPDTPDVITDINDHLNEIEIFTVYSSHGILRAQVNSVMSGSGALVIYNIFGQKLFTKKVYEIGQYELDPGLVDGIYLINYISGAKRSTKKLFIQD